jgi:hypothetical protein
MTSHDPVFEQLAKEMAVFAQNNHHSFEKLHEFFKYELYLRCVSKSNLKLIAREIEPDADKTVVPTYEVTP